MSARLLQGDCLQVMADMLAAGEQVDAIVTDPPYELGFMGKSWDSTGIANNVEMWRRAYDLLKPGGHMLAFSGTRTYHRMVCAIEDAGFEVRDQIGWMYGTGFPKSLDVSKAIDKAAGAERLRGAIAALPDTEADEWDTEITVTAPEAQQWAGWGTALKPAWEPICVARKPLSEKNVAANVLAHGTGAINIDACRIEASDKTPAPVGQFVGSTVGATGLRGARDGSADNLGRWPANVIHDGSDEVLEAFAAFGERSGAGGSHGGTDPGMWAGKKRAPIARHNDSGTAARFFYSSKAGKADRAGSKHPTVKPISLMRYLCKLVTPPGGTVLDMFAGSGTTLQAATEEGFSAIGIEREDEYARDIRRRLGVEDDTDALMAELFA